MAQIFCPFCGAKNEDSASKCFICEKKFPWVCGGSGAPGGGRRARSGPLRTLATASSSSSEGVPTARLGDRLIAVILDSVVVAAAVVWRWPHLLVGYSAMTLAIGAAAAALLLTFIYYWLQEGAFGATMG